MASACIYEQDLGKVLKHLHPNIVSNIDSYKEGSYYIFPTYRGCHYRIETEPEKRYSTTEENSVSHQSIFFVGDQLKRNT